MARISRVCTVDGCENPHRAKGLCLMHRMRMERHGTLESPSRAGTARSQEKRFWDNVDKSGPIHPVLNTHCWVWQGALNKGYGGLRINGKKVAAHRYSFSLFNGDTPSAVLVCHHCDNRACVNPEHLFGGTFADNAADMVEKGRSCKGELYGTAKLKEAEVLEIRRLHNGGMTQTALGKRFSVDTANINAIVHRRTWKHI